jgi:type I restriction enzyme S subunit
MTADVASLVSDNLDTWTTAIERKSGAGRSNGKRVSLYGIERLRALILDLAVRGKLVPQDRNDEPVAELLKRIRKAKLRRLQEGDIRKPREFGSGPELPVPFSIPETWQWVRLDEVGAIVGGGTPPSGSANNFVEGGQGVPWLTPADLGGYKEQYISHGARDLTQSALKASSATIMPAGSVLFTSRAPIGYVAIASNPISTNQGFKSIVPYIAETSLFIATAMKSFAKAINDSAPGTTFKEVSGKLVAALPFPLPPIAEQHRVVAKVDELMALCDTLEGESVAGMAAHQALVETLLATLTDSTDADDLATNWKRLEAHFDNLLITEASIDALKQAILELAVRGKLVPQDRAEEPASEILARLGKESQQKHPTAETAIGDIPSSWAAVELGQVIGPMDSGWSPACHEFPARTEETWGVLKTTAVQYLKYVPEQNKELPEHLAPRPDAETLSGDLLITRAGPTNRVGVCCFVAETRPRLMISDKIIRFRPASGDISGEFIALALSVGFAAEQIEKAKSGMAASQVNISQAKLRGIILGLAPAGEQKRIVAKVNELMGACEALKSRLNDAAITQKHLADAIAEKAAA